MQPTGEVAERSIRTSSSYCAERIAERTFENTRRSPEPLHSGFAGQPRHSGLDGPPPQFHVLMTAQAEINLPVLVNREPLTRTRTDAIAKEENAAAAVQCTAAHLDPESAMHVICTSRSG
jgi:hypothetical protein